MDEADRVQQAFAAVPRAHFLPRGARSRAGEDIPILIGRGQTSSQPRTVGDMLRLLDVRPGQRVLDVRSGSGWTTALLAHLTGAAGEVVGVELEPDLARWGAANVARAGMPWATVHRSAPGVLGDPEHGPWDRILVSADAPALPRSLVEQLGDPGRLVLPVAGTMTLVVREHGSLVSSHHGHYRFVPLRSDTDPAT
ncbi:fibrillarin-like rRNA methylase [Terrabacter aerolatus]|uniref:Protein-L-isoaspartate O-methyltransferase n=1 Tax=Terrabacter aerolatus TaxID=422442 RepID=A0A512CYP3_9MICO|nr:protein-L-isoaspartate O-methyltransferase [Terrabacter aerolatus]GEO29343.1 fibrillarin-like rRNA methylase [Terrabacter aerolatus]